MRKALTTIFLLLSLSLFSQRTETFYDYKWEVTTPGRALFLSILEKEADRYHAMYYYIRERKVQMDGYFADSSRKIKEGPFLYYYPNGNLQTKCFYQNNKLHGQYLSHHMNGMMSDSLQYSEGRQVGVSFSWYPDGSVRDSTNLNEDGSGASVSWNPDGSPSAAGFYGPGKKMRGTWQFFHQDGKLSSRERYEEGVLVDKQYFNEKGEEEKDTTNTDRKVSFPGGTSAWIKYLSNHAHFPRGFEIVNSDAIVVIVNATIDENGKVTDAYVSATFHPTFDAIALKAMRLAPNWLPAIEHHRKVKSYVRQPITFSQPE